MGSAWDTNFLCCIWSFWCPCLNINLSFLLFIELGFFFCGLSFFLPLCCFLVQFCLVGFLFVFFVCFVFLGFFDGHCILRQKKESVRYRILTYLLLVFFPGHSAKTSTNWKCLPSDHMKEWLAIKVSQIAYGRIIRTAFELRVLWIVYFLSHGQDILHPLM